MALLTYEMSLSGALFHFHVFVYRDGAPLELNNPVGMTSL